MEIRNRIFEKYIDHTFSIPLRDSDRVLIKKGKIDVNKALIERFESTLKKTIYIPDILKCKESDCKNYILKIDGEYIDKGEIIAGKTSKGGLTITEVKSPIGGILDLSRVEHGYIDILGEEKESILESNFNGEVVEIDPVEGLVVKSNIVAVDGVVSSRIGGKIFGVLEVLGDGKTILKENVLEDNYRGKIVWVGPYLYNRVAIELFERGALAVLTYAMSYSDFRSMGLPVMILGGFGFVHCDNLFLDKLLSFKGKYLIFDNEENQIFILSDSTISNRDWIVNRYTGQRVISRATSTYGYIGKVLEHEEDTDFLIIDFDKKGTAVIHIGLVDFVDL